jgi:hypothetical protein
MIRIARLFIIIACYLTLENCDTKKEYTDDIALNIICYSFAGCNQNQPARIGMIGDSWTDLLIGYPFVETLRVQLEKNHGYQITGATLGGQTLEAAANLGLQYQVIDQAGASVKVILLSLGGNDIQANLRDYTLDLESARSLRFSKIKSSLRNIIQTGNAYKLSKFGGSPLKWIIHGYDYTNPNMRPVIPDADEGCNARFVSAGFNLANVEDFSSKQLDAYNEMLRSFTSEEPTYYYVDLRRTLGGPPKSNANLMLDCIHPNNLGFEFLGNKLSRLISPITGISQ